MDAACYLLAYSLICCFVVVDVINQKDDFKCDRQLADWFKVHVS